MRATIAGLAVGVLAAAPVATAAASGTTHATPAATKKVVVRPVTSSGQAAPGFGVRGEPRGRVDCSFADPSAGAVSRNIESCSPSVEYAVACWKAAAHKSVLCLRDARVKRLVRIPRMGKFAATPPPKPADRAPLLVVLSDGTHCTIRDGGAWGQLKGHPRLFGTYSCDRHGAVWARSSAPHSGVNESHASWTVRTAEFGKRHLATRHVARAYFVGTAQK